MRTAAAAVLLISLLAWSASAEEIVLKDGTKLYGRLVRDEGQIAVTDHAGNTIVLDQEVEKITTLEEMREELGFIIERSGEKPDRFSLGCWCWKRGLFDEAREQFAKVLETDPENPGARWALGYIKVRGIWVESGVWTKLPDQKEAWVRWFPSGDKGKVQLKVGERPNDVRDSLRNACKRDPEISEQGARELAAVRPAELAEGLILSLKDPSHNVRKEAARRLGNLKGFETARALAAAALCDSDRNVRGAAVESLTRGEFPDARDLVIDGLDEGRLDVRMNAIDALPGFPARETVDALTAVMASGTPRIPRVNIFVGRHTAYVADFDVEVASSSSIGDPILATQMEGVVLDVAVVSIQERIVMLQRRAARRSLCRIAGKDLGDSVEVWRKWAEETYKKRS